MKKKHSTNRLSELEQQLDGDHLSPPPPPSPSGSGSLFNLEKAVEKPKKQPQPQNYRRQVRSFDDGKPIEVITPEGDDSLMTAQAFDFNEDITVQQQDYAKASSWDDDYAEASPWDDNYPDEMATGDVPFQASSFEPEEEEISHAAEFTNATSSDSNDIAREVEALRHEMRSLKALALPRQSLQQPPASTAQSSPHSDALGARLQEIRNEVKQLQWQKQQQPPQQTEALAAQMEALRDELRSLRNSREAEALNHEYWEALELEPTFQDFDQKMDEEHSPSLSETAQHVPVEVVPPQAPYPQAKAMEVELAEQFAEFDRMMELETVDAMELAEGWEYGSGIGSQQYASQLGVENIYMYLDANRTGERNGNPKELSKKLVSGKELKKWIWGENGKGAIILCQGGVFKDNDDNDDNDENDENDEKKGDELVVNTSELQLAPLVFYPHVTDEDDNKDQKLGGTLEVSPTDHARIQIYESIKKDAKELEAKLDQDKYKYHFEIPKEGLILGMAAKRYDQTRSEKPIKLKFIPIVDEVLQKTQRAEVIVAPWMMPHIYSKTNKVYVAYWKHKPQKQQEESKQEQEASRDWELVTKFIEDLQNIFMNNSLNTEIVKIPIDGSTDVFVQDAAEIGYSNMPGQKLKLNFSTLISPLKRWEVLLTNESFPNQMLKLTKIEQTDKNKYNTIGFGNIEVTPPLPDYPWGRIYFSIQHTSGNIIPEYAKFLDAQKVQKPFALDASWLEVGHVDETVCFLPTKSKNQLIACIPSPTKAYELLEIASKMFQAEGFLTERKLKNVSDPDLKEISTIDLHTFLSVRGKTGKQTVDTSLMQLPKIAGMDIMQIHQWNKIVQIHLDSVKQTLEKEVSKSIHIIEVPVLFKYSSLGGGYSALTSNMVNMLIVDSCCIFPKPYGPIAKAEAKKILEVDAKGEQKIQLSVKPGQDVFEEYMLTMFKEIGLKGESIDTWEGYHLHDGEVHCATNTWRQPKDETKWWNWLKPELSESHS
ncbi:MAG: hypothetical protein F6K36_13555 [Symploca sp. SIO3C6]|nr:hypothetical protein [Symploca sp. SIO3C6]